MKLSVVTSLYKSSPYLAEFHARTAAVAASITPDFEIIYVDDGSPDDSASLVKRLLREQPKIRGKLVALSRNHGQYPALLTGIEHADGDLVFVIDCDLEEPPELLVDAYRRMQAAAAEDPPIDLIYAVQDRRKGGAFERIGGSLFYSLFNSVSKTRIEADTLTARLLTRRMAQAISAHQEREVFFDGIMSLAGFRQERVLAIKGSKGATTYTPLRRLSLAVDALTSFSDGPLIGIFILGIAISLIALFGMAWIIGRHFLFGDYLAGWPSLIVTIWFLGGMTLMSIGVLGLYVARVLVEVKRRPRVIREIYTGPRDGG